MNICLHFIRAISIAVVVAVAFPGLTLSSLACLISDGIHRLKHFHHFGIQTVYDGGGWLVVYAESFSCLTQLREKFIA